MGMQVEDQLSYIKITKARFKIFIAIIDVVPQVNKTVLFVHNI